MQGGGLHCAPVRIETRLFPHSCGNSILMNTLAASSTRPTNVRMRVLFICFCSSVLLYLDRFCMNFAQQYVKEDLLLTDDQLGNCMSAFFFAYALFQVPSGWLTDRYGPRSTMVLYILVWSMFTALMGAVMGFVGLLVVRMASGIGQAGAYPTCASVVRRWMPTESRGRASSVVAFGGRVGGAIAPILTAALVIAFVPVETSPLVTNAEILSLDEIQRLQSGQAAKDANENPDILRRLDLAESVLNKMPNTSLFEKRLLASEYSSLITGEIITTSSQLMGIGLEKEGVRLLKQAEISPQEQQRLNRLILEAIFPKTIKKIYVNGWRAVMIVYGLLGLPVALSFWWIVRNSPTEHPHTNQAECDLPPATVVNSDPTATKLPIRQVLQSRSLWLMSISQFLAVMGWTFLVTWLPRYLLEVHQVPFETRGWMISIPLWCGWFGMLFGGWLTDALTHQLGLKWGRALPIGVGRTCAGCCFLYIVIFHPSAWLAVGSFALIAVFTDLGSSAFWAVHQDIGGKFTAAVLGWGNMWGNFGSAVSPLLIQALLVRYGNWDMAFLACGGSFLIAGIMAFFVDVRETISD